MKCGRLKEYKLRIKKKWIIEIFANSDEEAMELADEQTKCGELDEDSTSIQILEEKPVEVGLKHR